MKVTNPNPQDGFWTKDFNKINTFCVVYDFENFDDFKNCYAKEFKLHSVLVKNFTIVNGRLWVYVNADPITFLSVFQNEMFNPVLFLLRKTRGPVYKFYSSTHGTVWDMNRKSVFNLLKSYENELQDAHVYVEVFTLKNSKELNCHKFYTEGTEFFYRFMIEQKPQHDWQFSLTTQEIVDFYKVFGEEHLSKSLRTYLMNQALGRTAHEEL